MIIEVGESGHLLLKEVYESIVLQAAVSKMALNSDYEFVICMRDDGFEFRYRDTWYEAKDGFVRELNSGT